ncbi:PAS domain S-box protein [Methanofollis fontis]|uniref:histidine kinase n=1 Tax=Methanofollis fontis TaxID=2052832 RepID=A0A483CVF9_9EURY|nr:PAS domain S-box protein [Methanofollis fontis]TAJ45491.1 hypothetical protein CUJ86_01820 [Methanofollis fontis]
MDSGRLLNPIKPQISVLYVDDEPSLLEIGKLFLERKGNIAVTPAPSAEDALSILDTGTFDGVVSDYQMPGMDGIDLLREVRKLYGPLPFIIFTGKGREEVVIEALNSGADYYLQKGGAPKPQFAELENIIRHAVEKSQMARALEESEERYRTVVEDQSEMICWFDPDGVILFANEAFCRHFGVPGEEMVGRRFAPEIPLNERERLHAHFESLTPDHPVAHIDHRVIMPSGEVRWHGWTDRASFDAAGNLVRIQSVGRDISDHKRAEIEAVASRQRLKDVLDFLPDPTFAIDAEGKATLWNGEMERLTGVPAEAVIGQSECDAFIHPHGPVRPVLAEIVIGLAPKDATGRFTFTRWKGDSLLGEIEVTASDGSERVLWGLATPLWGHDGTIVGAIESLHDVTDLRASERTLHEANGLLEWMFDALPDIIGIMRPDRRIIRYNRAGYEALGVTHEEASGNPCYSLIGRSRPCEICATEMALKSGKPETIEKYVPELDMHLRCTSVPIFAPDGEVSLVVEQLSPIPERGVERHSEVGAPVVSPSRR